MNNVKGKILPNPFPLPLIQYEELWEKPLMLPGYEYDWDKKVSVSERLYRHNTLGKLIFLICFIYLLGLTEFVG